MKQLVCVVACGALCLYSLSCAEKKPIAWESVGTFVSCDVIPTSFNESIKSRVETTEGCFIIAGTMSGLKGTGVFLSDRGTLALSGMSGKRIIDM